MPASHTFEEVAARELDSLYQGALFLHSGDLDGAEALLQRTLSKAFHAYRASSSIQNPGRWLQARLAQEFIDRSVAVGGDLFRRPTPTPATVEGTAPRFEAKDMYDAAAALPGAARAVVWMVVLKRWGYEAAAEVLGLEEEELRGLLEYRHTLVAELMRAAESGNGMGRTAKS